MLELLLDVFADGMLTLFGKKVREGKKRTLCFLDIIVAVLFLAAAGYAIWSIARAF